MQTGTSLMCPMTNASPLRAASAAAAAALLCVWCGLPCFFSKRSQKKLVALLHGDVASAEAAATIAKLLVRNEYCKKVIITGSHTETAVEEERLYAAHGIVDLQAKLAAKGLPTPQPPHLSLLHRREHCTKQLLLHQPPQRPCITVTSTAHSALV
jgi:hypothetical protein